MPVSRKRENGDYSEGQKRICATVKHKTALDNYPPICSSRQVLTTAAFLLPSLKKNERGPLTIYGLKELLKVDNKAQQLPARRTI